MIYGGLFPSLDALFYVLCIMDFPVILGRDSSLVLHHVCVLVYCARDCVEHEMDKHNATS